MINQQIIDFIKLQLQKNLDKETITKELLANGWSVQDIEESFSSVGNLPPGTSSTLNISSPVSYTHLTLPTNREV